MKTCFIVNPRSGRAARALPGVSAFARARGMAVKLTERPQHARELAAQAIGDGYELVAAVGGDGTMNEVATALVGTGATLGLVPCGSGDGLGRCLGLHGAYSRALAVLETGRPRLIDTGLADGHAFFNIAGLGFEALLAERYNQLKRRGFLRYLAASTRAFRHRRSERCTLTTPSGRRDFEALTLAVANSEQYGNNARIAPGAQLDDGLLDLCAVPPVTLFNVGPLAARMFAGSLNRNAGVIHERGTRFVVERGAPGLIHTDGEVHAAGATVEFVIRPASLRIMGPAID